jgi:hypothetical protein
MRGRRVAVAVCLVMLSVASVVVFMLFDGRSNSASDTIRPFLITMGPAWLLFVLAWRMTAKPRK